MQGKFTNIINNNWKAKTFIFLFSQTLSQFGSAVVGFAIVWYITLETGSSSLMTISILATFIPQIIVSPFAGVWADRYNRKMLIIFSDLLTAVATLVMAVYFLLGNESLNLIFAISAIRSFGAGIQMPAVGAILPQIVPIEKLTRINGINSGLNSGMMLLSPAVAGMVLGTFGFGYTLLIDVVTALSAVLVLTFLRVRRQHKISNDVMEEKKENTIFSELKEGIVYTKNHPFIGRLLVIYAVFFFLITPAAFLTPIMIVRSFGNEVWRLTANEMMWTGGAVIGGGIIAFKGNFKDKIKTLAVSSLGFGITFILLGLSKDFMFYLSVMFVSGIFLPYFSTAETVLIQENVEEHILGRVYSMVQIIISSVMPLGMLLFGPLGDAIRIESIMIASGFAIILLTPYIWKTKTGKGEI